MKLYHNFVTKFIKSLLICTDNGVKERFYFSNSSRMISTCFFFFFLADPSNEILIIINKYAIKVSE